MYYVMVTGLLSRVSEGHRVVHFIALVAILSTLVQPRLGAGVYVLNLVCFRQVPVFFDEQHDAYLIP